MTAASAPSSSTGGLAAIVIDAQAKILARTASKVAGFTGRGIEPGRFLDEAITPFGEAFYECVNTAARTGDQQFERRLESEDSSQTLDLWFQPCSAGKPPHDGAVVVLIEEAPDGRDSGDEGQSRRHNLQNILAQVRGLVALGQKEATSLPQFANLFCDRVDVLIAVDGLYAGADLAPIRAVTERTAGVAGLPDISMEGEDIAIARALGLPLALILHEWTSPLARHAHAGSDHPPVTVSWRMEDATLMLDWTERGANEHARRTSPLAERLIEATIYRAGGLVHEREAGGAMCRTIRLPLG